jgi:hypothetical protein
MRHVAPANVSRGAAGQCPGCPHVDANVVSECHPWPCEATQYPPYGPLVVSIKRIPVKIPQGAILSPEAMPKPANGFAKFPSGYRELRKSRNRAIAISVCVDGRRVLNLRAPNTRVYPSLLRGFGLRVPAVSLRGPPSRGAYLNILVRMTRISCQTPKSGPGESRGENEYGQHKTPQVDQICRFENLGKQPIVAEGTGM